MAKCKTQGCENEVEYGGLCSKCIDGYDNAFYKISAELFGIRVKGVKYIDK